MSGVPITVVALPVVTPTAGDSIPVWDTESGLQGRVTLSGLGTYYAMLAGATFTGNIDAQQIRSVSGAVQSYMIDNGAGAGASFLAWRNGNVTTPAAGHVVMQNRSAGFYYVWPDAGGLLRIYTGAPTSANDTAGTVVGAQSSHVTTKDVQSSLADLEEVPGYIAQGAAAVRRFRYKAPVSFDENGAEIEGTRPYNGEAFEGVVLGLEDAPANRYGTDGDDQHPEGKSLNTINAIGDLLRAVDWLVAQNDALTARVLALEEGAGA